MDKLYRMVGFDPTIHSPRTEVVAGFTTFLAMAYVLVVNPMILAEAGIDQAAQFTATALASALGTLLIAFLAKMPLAQAPAMGVNVFFAYTLVGAMGYSWQAALTATFVEGVIFILLTVFNVRKKICAAVPVSLQSAISVGIGFFIAFIGLKSGGIIIANDVTYVALAPFRLENILSIAGVIICTILLARKVRGAMFLSICAVTLLSFIFGASELPDNFSPISLPHSIAPIFCQFDFAALLSLDMILLILVLAFVDIFNTLGTIICATSQCGYINEDGEIKNVKELMLSDSIATMTGAMLGTSTVTTYAESLAGVAEGGRTGLTSLVVAALFLISLLLSPIFMLVPTVATAGVMIVVGSFMVVDMKRMPFDDINQSMPAFITAIVMVLSFSIAEGIAMGIICHTIINLLSPSWRKVTPWQVLITVLFLVRYIYML